MFDVERVSRLLQAEYPTGVRMACSPCAAAGRDELGLPDRIEGDPTPLCLECWRRRERQTGRRGTAVAVEPVEWVDELPAGCPACESPDPSPGCWLCGYSWLADARAAHERLLQAEQAAVEAEFARMTVREQAAKRVEWLTGWVRRLRDVVGAYTGTGGRGAGWGRAVELLADALARDAAVHAGGPGRPSVFRLVAAVMAVDADYRSGRRAMPGRAECAELAGVCERAVTSAWRRGVQLGAWVRTTLGRRLTLDERMETGRGNDRAVYDLRPVTRSTDTAARDAMVPAALAALDELLAWGLKLLYDAEHDLDQLDAPYRGTGRAPDADTLVVRAARAALRQAVVRTRAAATVFADHLDTGNKCSPHTVSRGECVSSCLRGLSFTFVDRVQVRARQRPRRGRGKSDNGASRSPTRDNPADLGGGGRVRGRAGDTHPVGRPRTAYVVGGASRDNDVVGRKATTDRRRPQWHDWAYPLARGLRELWPWLRYEPLHLVAATLGARLGPRWTAGDVVGFVEQARAGRALPVDLHTPVGMLRELLEDALTGGLQPPCPARRHDEHRREAAAVAKATETARHDRLQAEFDRRDAAAAQATGSGRAEARNVLADIAQRRSTQRHSNAASGSLSEPVAQSGTGLPVQREPRS